MLAILRYKRRYANDPEVLLASLRVSAHIVDKGLQSENCEKDRSRAQYETLCKYIDRLSGSVVAADNSYQWALEKKREYEELQRNGTRTCEPYRASQSGVSRSQLLQLIRGRRSARAFEERRLEPDLLRELAEVASWSATSCNRQPTKLFFTQNPKTIGKCLQQCAGATCLGKNIPCFAAVCADTRFYTLPDRNLAFVDASLGIQNALLLAHVQGVEGTILNWMHHTPRQETLLREALGIPEYYLVAFNLILGYPRHSVPAPGRKGNRFAYALVDHLGSPNPAARDKSA